MEIICPECNFKFDGEFKFDKRINENVCTCPECEVIFDNNDDIYAAEGDDWNEMSWERGGGESDEDYQERLDGLND